jgi:hypothetical protein
MAILKGLVLPVVGNKCHISYLSKANEILAELLFKHAQRLGLVYLCVAYSRSRLNLIKKNRSEMIIGLRRRNFFSSCIRGNNGNRSKYSS